MRFTLEWETTATVKARMLEYQGPPALNPEEWAAEHRGVPKGIEACEASNDTLFARYDPFMAEVYILPTSNTLLYTRILHSGNHGL